MSASHTHHCRNIGCPTTWTCEADLERNYDGFPEVICPINPGNDIECQACEESRCADCGSVLRVEAHSQHCEAKSA
jgi:hypothetical protein